MKKIVLVTMILLVATIGLVSCDDEYPEQKNEIKKEYKNNLNYPADQGSTMPDDD